MHIYACTVELVCATPTWISTQTQLRYIEGTTHFWSSHYTKSEVMDEKERDIYINHLTRRASGARTVSSPAPPETT